MSCYAVERKSRGGEPGSPTSGSPGHRGRRTPGSTDTGVDTGTEARRAGDPEAWSLTLRPLRPARQPRRRPPFPRVREQVGQQRLVGGAQIHPHGGQALAPPDLGADRWVRLAAVRIPASSSITFMCSSSQRVAKILPATRNEGRPWWSCSTVSGARGRCGGRRPDPLWAAAQTFGSPLCSPQCTSPSLRRPSRGCWGV